MAAPADRRTATYSSHPSCAPQIEDCLREIAALDASHGAHLGALGTMLLRTESVASSKIEQVEADVTDYARALHGMKANQSATSMVSATVALEELIDSVNGGATSPWTRCCDHTTR